MKLTSTHYIIGVILVGLLFQSGTLKLAKPGTVCGNGVCEKSENTKNCAADCSGGGGGKFKPTVKRVFEYKAIAPGDWFVVTYVVSGVPDNTDWVLRRVDTISGGCNPYGLLNTHTGGVKVTLVNFEAPYYDSVCVFEGTFEYWDTYADWSNNLPPSYVGELRTQNIVIDSSLLPPPPPW